MARLICISKLGCSRQPRIVRRQIGEALSTFEE